MARSSAKRKLTGLGVFILPVLIVKGTGVLLSPAGVSAYGGPGGGEVAIANSGLHDGTHEWSEQELAAARYVAELAKQSFGDNPLYYKPRDETPVEQTPTSTDPKPSEPTFTVTAVMKAGGTALALVDGRMRRAGDSVQDGAWRIVAIDQDARSVTFEEIGGRLRTIKRRVRLPD